MSFFNLMLFSSCAGSANGSVPIRYNRLFLKHNWACLTCARMHNTPIPSSVAAERVFSVLKASFNESQDHALQDYLESSLMLQYNKRE